MGSILQPACDFNARIATRSFASWEGSDGAKAYVVEDAVFTANDRSKLSIETEAIDSVFYFTTLPRLFPPG